MIKVINISKTYGRQKIFDNVNFSVSEGEKIGLIGRNGHGKTTLFKIITGEEHPDEGEIVLPKEYSIGSVSQHINFTQNSVIEEGCLGLSAHSKDNKWLIEKILFGLGFSKEDMLRNPNEFSGGYQVRLNLAKALGSEPSMLLLDEPTNYLDIVSIRWLSSFLRQWKGELLLITHDRSFMDNIVTHILGIHRSKIRKMSGNTEKYYEQIIKEEEIHEKTRLNDEKKRKETELFISRFRAKARLAGMVQSRIKALNKSEKMDKLEKIKSLEFSFRYSDTQAKSLLHIKDLKFAYDDKNFIINNLSFSVNKKDRICIIGKNGKGKSTLLKLIKQELAPKSGEILFHPSVNIGYYAQTNVINLNDSLTVEEELMSAGCERQHARDICGAMMFEGDNALKHIKVLSGGEKSRVMLGKIIASSSNLLLLDEPTNHLDMESCDAFLASIDDFEGACIIVTHNETFLHTLAERFIIFQNDGIRVFEGPYQSFLDKIGWEDEEKPNSDNAPAESEPLNKKELRKIKADILSRKSKELKPLEVEISSLEKQLEENEAQIAKTNTELIDASAEGNGEKIQTLSKRLHALKTETELLYDKLDKVICEFELKSTMFKNELESVDAIS